MNFTGINTLVSTLKRNLSGPIGMMIRLLLLLMTLISSLDLQITFVDDRGLPFGEKINAYVKQKYMLFFIPLSVPEIVVSLQSLKLPNYFKICLIQTY